MRVGALLMSGFQWASQTFCHASFAFSGTCAADEYNKDYAAKFIVGLREMHHICLFPYDTADPQARQETLDMTKALVREAAFRGNPPHTETRCQVSLNRSASEP
jgi:hypothetical protein